MDLADIRADAIKSLDPLWQELADDATRKAGVVNPENADASYWNRNLALTWADRCRTWSGQAQKALQAGGAESDPMFNSVSGEFSRQVARLTLLNDKGLAVSQGRSAIERLVGIGGPSQLVTGVQKTGEAIGKALDRAGLWGKLLPAAVILGLAFLALQAFSSKSKS